MLPRNEGKGGVLEFDLTVGGRRAAKRRAAGGKRRAAVGKRRAAAGGGLHVPLEPSE